MNLGNFLGLTTLFAKNSQKSLSYVTVETKIFVIYLVKLGLVVEKSWFEDRKWLGDVPPAELAPTQNAADTWCKLNTLRTEQKP